MPTFLRFTMLAVVYCCTLVNVLPRPTGYYPNPDDAQPPTTSPLLDPAPTASGPDIESCPPLPFRGTSHAPGNSDTFAPPRFTITSSTSASRIPLLSLSELQRSTQTLSSIIIRSGRFPGREAPTTCATTDIDSFPREYPTSSYSVVLPFHKLAKDSGVDSRKDGQRPD